MKVVLKRSGGFIGMIKSCELDTAALEKEGRSEEAASLRSLVTQSDILDLNGKEYRTPNARDLFNYSITVETSSATSTVRFDERSIDAGSFPAGIAKLFNDLKRRLPQCFKP